MTPKEKAKQIFDKMMVIMDDADCTHSVDSFMKECALVAVNLRLDGIFVFISIEFGEDSIEYWEQVKTEIENL
jgi:hypothetical protein